MHKAPSERFARIQFENGFGDALITYEQETLWDRARGRFNGEIIYPRSTILSEHTLVKVDRNIEADEQHFDKRYYRLFLERTSAVDFFQQGVRSVDERLNPENSFFGQITDPFSIEDFGGGCGFHMTALLDYNFVRSQNLGCDKNGFENR